MMHGNFKLLAQILHIHLLKFYFSFGGIYSWFLNMDVSLLIQHQNFTFCFDSCSTKSVRFKCVCYSILYNWYN